MGREIVAMILAGGRGTRLEALTAKVAKPAVHFGGKYRIIDFPLSNCANSGIDIVGVLTQYESVLLGTYVGAGTKWGLDGKQSLAAILPARERGKVGATWYAGTADAIYQNISFLDQYDPEYVLILSGDHIYKMDYDKMLTAHKQRKADATIAVLNVSMKEASRFGIMNTNEDGSIYEFEEKPKEPKSNLASMGIYIFDWKTLRAYFKRADETGECLDDFGHNVIPTMLEEGQSMFAYPFKGYWRDVGTIQSLWEANMDLINDPESVDLNDPQWRIYTNTNDVPPQYIGPNASVKKSLIADGCRVYGTVRNTVLSHKVQIGEGSVVEDSVIMPNVKIGENVVIKKAMIAEGAVIEDNAIIKDENDEISVVSEFELVKA